MERWRQVYSLACIYIHVTMTYNCITFQTGRRRYKARAEFRIDRTGCWEPRGKLGRRMPGADRAGSNQPPEQLATILGFQRFKLYADSALSHPLSLSLLHTGRMVQKRRATLLYTHAILLHVY